MVDFLVHVNRLTADVLRWLADALATAPRHVQAAMGAAIVVYLAYKVIVCLVTRLRRRPEQTQQERRLFHDRAAGARLKQLKRERAGHAEPPLRRVQPESDPHRPGPVAKSGTHS